MLSASSKQFQKQKINKQHQTEENLLDLVDQFTAQDKDSVSKNKISQKQAFDYCRIFQLILGLNQRCLQKCQKHFSNIHSTQFLELFYFQDKQYFLLENNRSQGEEQKATSIDEKTHQFLAKFQKDCRQKIETDLLKSKRFQKINQFTTQIIINQIYPSKHFEIVRLQIRYLWYKTYIQILNEVEKSCLHTCAKVADSGTFGSIYLLKFFNQNIAVKCIPFEKEIFYSNQAYYQRKLSKHLIAIIKEYFFLLMFSQLRIGPQVKTIGGFDMILYENCIEFTTQICSSIEQSQIENELYENLFVMHMFQVVHRDIKPSNIMYSSTYKKPVFIDFGCAQVINETLGQKTVTKFVGTSAYCTDQVINLLTEKRGQASLYFNDLYGLKKSVSQMKKTNGILYLNKQISILKECFQSIIQIKYWLYHQQFQLFYELWRKVRREFTQFYDEISIKVAQFFFQLKPNEFLKRFYFSQINQSIQQLPQFFLLNQIFKASVDQFFVQTLTCPEKQTKFRLNKIVFKTLYVQNNNNDLTIKQLQIQIILINKKQIKEKILEAISKVHIPNEQEFQFDWIQKLKYLSIMVAFYSSLASEQFKATIEDKIQVCNAMMKLIETITNFRKEYILIFETPFQHLTSISNFYHFLMYKMWRHISQIYKPQILITIMTNLHMLGYPSPMTESSAIYRNAFIIENDISQSFGQLSKQNRFYKILFYWESVLVYQFLGSFFFNTDNINILSEENTKFFNKSLIDYEKLFLFDKFEQHDFFEMINYKVFRYMSNYEELNQQELQKILQLLNSAKLYQILKISKIRFIKQWKSLLVILLRHFAICNHLQISINMNRIYNQNINFLIHMKHTIIPSVIHIFQSSFLNISAKSHYFEKFISIVNFKQISLRYQLQKQLQIAIQRKDLNQINEIVFLIERQTNQGIQVANLNSLISITQVIYRFVTVDCQQQLPVFTKQSLTLLNLLFKIFVVILIAGFTIFKCNFHKQYMGIENNQKIDAQNLMGAIIYSGKIRCFFFYIFSIGDFFNVVKQIAIQNGLDGYYRIQFEEKHQSFIQDLKYNYDVLLPAEKWFNLIQSKSDIKEIFKSSKELSIQLIKLYIQQRKLMGQIVPTQTVIDNLFGKLQAKKFLSKKDILKLPSLEIAFDYFQAHNLKSKYEINWCEQLFTIYKIAKSKDKQYDGLLFYNELIRYVFNCMVYTGQQFKEFEEFFVYLSKNLKRFPSLNNIKESEKRMKDMFWCKCKNCFPRYPQNWNHLDLSNYLISNIKSQRSSDNPYMSLIYLFALNNNGIQKHLIRKAVFFILKSMQYLNSHARQLIQTRLFLYIYKGFYQSRDKDSLEDELLPSQIMQKKNDRASIILSLRISKLQLNEKSNRQFINCFHHLKKNQTYKLSYLNQMVQQRFFIESLVEEYKIPEPFRSNYTKKIKRHYLVRQNYKQKQKEKGFKNLHRNLMIVKD